MTNTIRPVETAHEKMVRCARWYNRIGFNIVPFLSPGDRTGAKATKVLWKNDPLKNHQVDRQTPQDIHRWASDPDPNINFSFGMLAVNGVNGYHSFDIDKADTTDALFILLDVLGLPRDYPWITQSGSQRGFHVWFHNDEGEAALIAAGFPTRKGETAIAKAKYDRPALNPAHFAHMELRWKESLTALPPSIHPSGNEYHFFNEAPGSDEPPASISIARIKEAWDALVQPIVVIEDGQSSTIEDAGEILLVDCENETDQGRQVLKRTIARLQDMKADRYTAAFSKACYLFEWANAGHLNHDHVAQEIYSACNKNGTVKKHGKQKIMDTIKKARAHVGTQRRELPETGNSGQQTPETLDTSSLDQAIAASDQEALAQAIPILAQLDKKTYLIYEIRIKKAFGKDLHWNGFIAALSEERKLIHAKQAQARKAEEGNVEYEKNDDGMFYKAKYGEPVQLSNFTAEIVGDVITDDGAERTRFYEIDAALLGRQFSFELPAKDFTKCDWIDEHLGARARITTGQSIKSHLTNAIKYCSEPQEMFKFAHTGWRTIEGRMVYLHAGGFISQVSQVEETKIIDLTNISQFRETANRATLDDDKISDSQFSQVSQVVRGKVSSVSLHPPLDKYLFPEERTQVVQAVQASLRFLDLTRDTITVPLYLALLRAVLPYIDFGLHLAGQTGLGKTELVALIQQHFGAAMSAHKLPGSWESTENSLEMLLFQAKDTVVVIDDFKPKGSKNEQDRLHSKADRVFRTIGNGAGRGRLNSNLEQRAERRPRCMLISTGEDVPRGQSLKARGVVVTMTEPITKGEAAKKLYRAQKEARSGLYAQAMAAYIEWLAPRIETIEERLPDLVAAERDRLNIDGHGRSGTNTANLLLGLQFFLKFAYECHAITKQEAQQYLERCESALRQIADEAAQGNAQEKPSEQWRRLLIAALSSKSAHLATPKGDCPGTDYGWIKSIRSIERENGEVVEEETYRGGGVQIGWVDGNDIYLSPTNAYAAAKAMGTATGDEITTSESMLRKFLVQDKMLASTDLETPRKTIPVRRSLENSQKTVLHIKRGVLYPGDPPCNLVDNSDSSDLGQIEEAPQAGSDGSQQNGSAGNQSSQGVDYDKGKLTIDSLKTRLYAYLKLCPSGKQSVHWYAPGTSFNEEDRMVTPGAYWDRVEEEFSSGDRRRIRAMAKAIQTLMGKDGE